MKSFLTFSLILMLPISAFAESSLKKAYQREVGYLSSQKNTLEKRLKAIEVSGKKTTDSAAAKIKRLQDRWLYLQAESERLQTQLSDANAKGPSTEDQNDALLGTYEQGRQSLSSIGMTVPEKEKISAADYGLLYAEGLKGIKEGRIVRTQTETYFDAKGISKKGELTKIGRIAAYAEGLPLAPVGEGKFKIWPQVGKTQVGVVLFESVEKAMTPPKEKTIADTVKAGGTIAYIIVILGFFALFLLLVRAFFLIRYASPKTFASDLKAALLSRGPAKKLAMDAKGVVAQSASSLLEREDATVDDIDEIVGGFVPRIERFSTIIMVIAAIAPLLGLLGTVTGMIATFDIITEFGTGDPKLLSSGISEALITTKFGLVVAIPTLVFGNIFRAWGDNIIDEMEHTCLVILGAKNDDTKPPGPTGLRVVDPIEPALVEDRV